MSLCFGEAEGKLITQLAAGGDARIWLTGDDALNRYFAAPYPRDVLAYSSSTVSDISADAFAHLMSVDLNSGTYADWLGRLADRIKVAFEVEPETEIVFAPSGTDLEYVALASVVGRAAGGVHNVLLGADEIGSGCVHSARARFFAEETALAEQVSPGMDVPGFGDVSMVDIPVRCGAGRARSGTQIVNDMAREVERGLAQAKHCLLHGVHGSKTGLVQPSLVGIDAMKARFGDAVTFVIDACQTRITRPAIAAYLERGAIVLMTGSKFAGAPPFSGWALIPREFMARAAPLPEGLAKVCRRAEWPDAWPGVEVLPDTDNASLALRLEAAVFEIERFQALTMERVTPVIAAFEDALTSHLIAPLRARRVWPGEAGSGADLPIEMRTLATIDVSSMPGLATFDDARVLHESLARGGIRLGQPVKCVCLGGGRGWGGTLRVGLSMPMITRWAGQPIAAVRAEIESDMTRITNAILAATAQA